MVRGSAVDESGGVLPGVDVVASAVDGRTLGSTVTNSSGEFLFDSLPVGPVRIAFHLSGFVDGASTVTVRSSAGGAKNDTPLVQQLALATLTESVVVRAAPPPPPPPPRPVIVPVPPHDEASVCAPAKADGTVPAIGTVRSSRSKMTQGLFAAGDEIVIDGGTLTGLRVGQNLVAKRTYRTAWMDSRKLMVMGEHSSGLLQIVDADEQQSTAVVVYTCGGIMTGDYLTAFVPEPVRDAESLGKPAYEKAVRILFGDEGEMVGVTRRMMVIDRGRAAGAQPGQRVTLFRRMQPNDKTPCIVGEAVVVSVREDSSTILVEQATDAIFFGADGDWAAPQRSR